MTTLIKSQGAKIATVTKPITENGMLKGFAKIKRAKDKIYGPSITKKAIMLSNHAVTGNTIETLNQHPEGFGSSIFWDRKEPEALFVIFVNAADPFGASIHGLKATDEITVTSATGLASFSEKTTGFSESLIGLVATGLQVGSSLAGYPSAVPLITAAEKYVKDEFNQRVVQTKVRDAFGEDPSSGHKARAEGGVIICLPGSDGIYYSGNSEHKDRWIKADGTRLDTNKPKHVKNAFFIMRNGINHNSREIYSDGELYISAWDHKFVDNVGYYKVVVKLKKGNGIIEQPPIY